MGKIFTALGLMSGTSGDGVDASIISSDGNDNYSEIINKYFKYDEKIHENLEKLRDKISNSEDLNNNKEEINTLEKEITLFHAKASKEILGLTKSKVDFTFTRLFGP